MSYVGRSGGMWSGGLEERLVRLVRVCADGGGVRRALFLHDEWSTVYVRVEARVPVPFA